MTTMENISYETPALVSGCAAILGGLAFDGGALGLASALAGIAAFGVVIMTLKYLGTR